MMLIPLRELRKNKNMTQADLSKALSISPSSVGMWEQGRREPDLDNLKGRTSRILRQEFPYLKTKLPTLWTNSYFVSTVGGAPLNVIKEYVENQKTSQRK